MVVSKLCTESLQLAATGQEWRVAVVFSITDNVTDEEVSGRIAVSDSRIALGKTEIQAEY